MNKMNKIDIILLTCNDIFNTKDCINNLYHFTSNFNLVILDNGSYDGTVDLLEQLKKEKDNVILYLSKENLGCVTGRNVAYDLSEHSEYVCFLDNDQFVSKGWVESYMFYIDAGFDIVGFEGWQMNKNFYPKKRVSISEEFNYVGCGGMFLKRKVIEDIGLFDEEFNPMYFEDPHFCWIANRSGYKICWNEKKKIYHKPHKLLDKERRKHFKRSWDIFKRKWRGYKMPVFKNIKD
ncbi:MAG: glycosyltransferase [Clostridiales bacterium]|nr:glycosyltransferase [Clostridiales bacterium]